MSKVTTLEQMKAMAMRVNASLGQIAAATSEALEEMDANKASKAKNLSVSIPVSAWIANTDASLTAEGFIYMADVAVDGITATTKAEVLIAKVSRASAKSCGIADINDTQTNAVRLFSIKKPDAEIAVQISVQEGGG